MYKYIKKDKKCADFVIHCIHWTVDNIMCYIIQIKIC